jgi:hypothetical protein
LTFYPPSTPRILNESKTHIKDELAAIKEKQDRRKDRKNSLAFVVEEKHFFTQT